MPKLTRRRSSHDRETWRVYYGDVRVGTIGNRSGVPADVEQWGWSEKAHLTAEFDKARTDLAKRQAVVLAEVRNRLVIRSEPTQQPHHLDIASGFSFEPTAGLHPVQTTVDVKLQENRGMVRRPTSCRRLNPLEAHLDQIERIDKRIDHANGITLVNEIIEALGQ